MKSQHSPQFQQINRDEGRNMQTEESQSMIILQNTSELMNKPVDPKYGEIQLLGQNISARSYHSAVMHENCMYIYGGYDVNYGIYADLSKLKIANTNGYTMMLVQQENQDYHPGPRQKHSAVVFQNQMYIYGGLKSSLINTNEMHAYSFSENQWELVKYSTEGESIIPPNVDSHSVSLYKNGQQTLMISFGGFVKETSGGYSNQVHSFDFVNKQWQCLKTKQGPAPEKRCSASIEILGDVIYMFGGTNVAKRYGDMWKYDLKDFSWAEIQLEGSVPVSRNGHSMAVYQDKILLFGGIHDITHEMNDVYVFDPVKLEWKCIDQDSSHVSNEEGAHEQSNNIGDKQKDYSANNNNNHHHHPHSKTSPKASVFNQQSSVQSNNSYAPYLHTQPKFREFSPIKKVETNSSSMNSTLDFDQSVTMNSPTNTIEEGQQKRAQEMQKNLLLEFEMSPEEKQNYQNQSPTTETMKNTILSIGNPLSQQYPLKIEKDRARMNTMLRIQADDHLIIGQRPCARDGQSVVIKQNLAYIFGGNRHLMVYNDIFRIDLSDIELL